ncbi:MAG: FG-GAP-like repeat-containing protein, partial [Acidobacteriaceae bacterium]
MLKNSKFLMPLSLLLVCLPLSATGPSFHPDTTFAGSALTGWHTFGDAKWQAENGEIVATPNGGSGWLVLDRSYQDIGLYTQFRCTAACETGVLLRMEKTPAGMKGIYVALSEPDLPTYSVTIDSKGQITERNKLRRGGGLERIAPPPTNEAPREFHPPVSTVKLPFTPPDSSLRPTDWNQVEILFDANIVRTFLNDGREHGAVGDEGYGPIALYAGGAGEVRFKDLAYKDLGLKSRQPDKVSSNFRKQQLSDFYYSWSSSAADFNHDGILDVVSGPYIYYGPDYTKFREIYLAETVNPSTKFAGDAWMNFASDFTGDGWADLVTVSYGGANGGIYLYENPKGEDRRWTKYKVVNDVQSEIAVMRDVDGDGKQEIVYMGGGQVRYAKPDPSNPTGPWIVHNVSEKGYGTAHGIGVGDINGDGRLDILNAYGWWEQPAPGSSQETWTYHPEAFARYGRGIMGGSVMAVYDVNGDGLNDVVTVLNPHGWGMAWFEQKRDSSGNISFVKHMIMDDFSTKNAGGVVFSEPHGTTYADVDGDGVPDFIVGKRYWS